MHEFLLLSFDDLGEGRVYLVLIMLIVGLAIGGILARDLWAWFVSLGAEPTTPDDEAQDGEDEAGTVAVRKPVGRSFPGFGRRSSQI